MRLRTYFAYLTRLRQAIAHPFLLEGVMCDNFTLEDFSWLRTQIKKQGGRMPLHKQIGKWVEMEYNSHEGRSTFREGRFGYEFDMSAQLEDAERSKTTADILCRLCYKLSNQPLITEVSHASP